MSACDGFVQSSVVEGLPVALLEAAASGLACVATDAGGVERDRARRTHGLRRAARQSRRSGGGHVAGDGHAG